MEQNKKRIAVLGGDKRELIVIDKLLDAGYEVNAFALPKATLPIGARHTETAAAALNGTAACILPLPPLGEQGRLHSICEYPSFLDADTFFALPADFPIFTGVIKPWLQAAAGHCRLTGVMELEALAAPLAEATAEGAVAEAIRQSDGMLFGATALVIGYGRIGKALAWRLEALGMQVVVGNRHAQRADEAKDFGLRVGDWSQLGALAARSMFVFNTAPAPVLSDAVLRFMQPNALIIDLAEKPGGTDFPQAAEHGIKAILASGLPGKYAPGFSGEVMAEVYLDLLSDLFAEGEEK